MLYDLLSEYKKKGVTPMHMPGHKRNTAMLGRDLPYEIDITEIDGFDDLHDATGVLRELSERAARLYGSRKAYPLVNGATGGILAAVWCACRPGDTVIMARNCHKSVYNAVLTGNLKPAYLLPETDAASGVGGSITQKQVARAIQENPNARLVIVTSPTYEGVVSDIENICLMAHRHHIPVLVDAAHGAHFGFSEAFPPNPGRCGADMTVLSLHKTLPALTQCALALLNPAIIDESRFKASLSIYQTSSPSYVLLSSIDKCVGLLSDNKARLFEDYLGRLRGFDVRCATLKKLSVLCHGRDSVMKHPGFYGFDPGRIVILTRGAAMRGPALLNRLRSPYGLELEMACADYAVAVTSICDSPEALLKLSDAIMDIDSDIAVATGPRYVYQGILPRQSMTPGETVGLPGDYISPASAAGRIALEYVWAYPPGIPFLVPGEEIDGETVTLMRSLTDSGIALKSTKGMLPSAIYCR